MRKLLLSSVFAVFLLSLETGAVKAQTCTATPECAGLGYNKSKADCPKGALKCPTGDSYFCEEICEGKLAIGSILYEDFSFCSNVLKSKTALGVVVYLDSTGKHGQAMSAWPVDVDGNKSNDDVDVFWATYYGTTYDISSLPNYASSTLAAKDFNSCSNTDKILADRQTTYPAAEAARKYAPTTETKGKWCLPAAGVMTSIYNNQSAVQAGISKLGGVEYPSCCVWSSSEISDEYAWVSDFLFSVGLSEGAKNNNQYVRPVIEF